MNKRFSLFCVILLMAFASSCNLLDKKSRAEAKIFNDPPFSVLTDSIRQFPGNADLYLKRGQLLSQKNFHDLAFSDYKKAWELKPDETTASAYTANLFMAG